MKLYSKPHAVKARLSIFHWSCKPLIFAHCHTGIASEKQSFTFHTAVWDENKRIGNWVIKSGQHRPISPTCMAYHITWFLACCLSRGGILPYITYMGMCRPKGSWFWSFWFRTGYPFQRRFLERGIIFRMHESSTFVSSHLKVFKDRLLLKIRFNALTSKPLYSCCTLERSIKNWPISRTGYQF